MEVYKSDFVPHFIENLRVKLMNELPEKDCNTRMLWYTNRLTSDMVIHIIQAIAQNMKEDLC